MISDVEGLQDILQKKVAESMHKQAMRDLKDTKEDFAINVHEWSDLKL